MTNTCEYRGCTQYGDSVYLVRVLSAELCAAHRREWEKLCLVDPRWLNLHRTEYEYELLKAGVFGRFDDPGDLPNGIQRRLEAAQATIGEWAIKWVEAHCLKVVCHGETT